MAQRSPAAAQGKNPSEPLVSSNETPPHQKTTIQTDEQEIA